MMARQSAAQSGKRGFQASLRSTFRRGRQAFGAKSRRRHSPQADAGGHLPRRPAGRAGPARSRRCVRSGKKALTPDLGGEEQKKLPRSEEHTSELQSLMRISYAVFSLKKKTQKTSTKLHNITIPYYTY